MLSDCPVGKFNNRRVQWGAKQSPGREQAAVQVLGIRLMSDCLKDMRELHVDSFWNFVNVFSCLSCRAE